MLMRYPTPSRLLAELDAASGGRLERRDDLAIVLACGEAEDRRPLLADLSFRAKASHSLQGIMTRIGRAGEGYEKLEKEFLQAVAEMRTLLAELFGGAPADALPRLQTEYLAMTHDALGNLLALARDIRWYKNWLIDAGRHQGDRP
jgi:hypothetical protein